MTTLMYQDGYSNLIYFNRGELVYRTLNRSPFSNSNGPICFEYEIFKLNPQKQSRQELIEFVEKIKHPEECVLDIEATINLLKYRVIHKSLLENLRKGDNPKTIR